ncbi:MAG: hypothetical protein AAGA81_23800 [Acidobacteriota bacterium]
MQRLRIDLFGRPVVAEERDGSWSFFYPGEGKRRPAHDLRVDPGLDTQQMLAALADLCHEWATKEHPDVLLVD